MRVAVVAQWFDPWPLNQRLVDTIPGSQLWVLQKSCAELQLKFARSFTVKEKLWGNLHSQRSNLMVRVKFPFRPLGNHDPSSIILRATSVGWNVDLRESANWMYNFFTDSSLVAGGTSAINAMYATKRKTYFFLYQAKPGLYWRRCIKQYFYWKLSSLGTYFFCENIS